MRRALKRIVIGVAAVVFLYGLNWTQGKSTLARYRVGVEGVVVDARSGEPISGAWLLTVPYYVETPIAAWADAEIAKHQSDPSLYRYVDSTFAVSNDRGHFKCVQEITYGSVRTPLDNLLYSVFGIRDRPKVADRITVLLCGHASYERASFSVSQATYSCSEKDNEDRVVGVLEFGRLELQPK